MLCLAGAACGGGGGPSEPSASPGASEASRPPTPDGWFAVAPAPLPVTEVAAAAFAGAVWVAGGLDTRGQAARDVQVYDPNFDTWSPGPELLEPLHHAALVSTGDRLYLIGGYRGPGYDAPSAAVWVLDSGTGDWAEGPALPEPRAAGAAAWDGERLVYGGGVDAERAPTADVFALEDGEWRAMGELSSPREHLGAASDGEGTVWFLGGRRGGDLSTNVATVEVVRGDTIEAGTSLPTARGGVGAFWAPETGACLVGGEASSGTYAVVECLREDGTVHELPDMTQRRHGVGVALLDGMVYAAVGGPTPGLSATAVVEALNLASVD